MSNRRFTGRSFCLQVKDFLRFPRDILVRRLQRNGYEVEPWLEYCAMLGAAFSALPEAFRELWLVFGYRLPKLNPSAFDYLPVYQNCTVADVVVVSADTALVLGFEQTADTSRDICNELEEKRINIEKYHSESRNMKTEALLVLTQARGIVKLQEIVLSCAPDLLAPCLLNRLGNEPKPHPDIRRWMDSDFEDPSYQPSFTEKWIRMQLQLTASDDIDSTTRKRAVSSHDYEIFEPIIEEDLPDEIDAICKLFREGTIVWHKNFGFGKVTGLADSKIDADTKYLRIAFFEGVEKLFLFPKSVRVGFIKRVSTTIIESEELQKIKIYRFFSRGRGDTGHLYCYNTKTNEFFYMDHCWTGEGEWCRRDYPTAFSIVEISYREALMIARGNLNLPNDNEEMECNGEQIQEHE